MKYYKINNKEDLFPESEYTFSEVMEYAGAWDNYNRWLDMKYKLSYILTEMNTSSYYDVIEQLAKEYEQMVKDNHNDYGIREFESSSINNIFLDCPRFEECVEYSNICHQNMEKLCANCEFHKEERK